MLAIIIATDHSTDWSILTIAIANSYFIHLSTTRRSDRLKASSSFPLLDHDIWNAYSNSLDKVGIKWTISRIKWWDFYQTEFDRSNFHCEDYGVNNLLELQRNVSLSESKSLWSCRTLLSTRTRFGLVSLFNGISTFFGYLIPKLFS